MLDHIRTNHQPCRERLGITLEDRMKLTDDQRAELEAVLNREGCAPGGSLHSWRCEDKDRYPEPCDCVAGVVDELAPLIEGWLSPAETPIRSGQTWTNHLDKSVRIAGQVDTAAGAQPLGELWVADSVDTLFGRRWLVTDAWLAECGYELAEEPA